MSAGLPSTAVPTSIHCDHLIQAFEGAEVDLKVCTPRLLRNIQVLRLIRSQRSVISNKEVFDFLESAARKYGKYSPFFAPAISSHVV